MLMKRLLIIVLTLTLAVSLNSCGLFQRPAKCAAYDNIHAKTDKKGQFKKSKTKSHLFPTDMNTKGKKKRMKKRKKIDRRQMNKRAMDKRKKYRRR